MTLTLFGLITSYLILALALLLILLKTNGSPQQKAIAIIVISLFYGIHYDTLLSSRGWPIHDNLPPRFRLIGAEIQEPNPITGHDGAVYLWVADMDDLAGFSPPRSYGMEYDELLHKMVTLAMQKIASGHPQIGTTQHPNTSGMMEGQTLRKSRTTIIPQVSFHDLPVYVLPEK